MNCLSQEIVPYLMLEEDEMNRMILTLAETAFEDGWELSEEEDKYWKGF